MTENNALPGGAVKFQYLKIKGQKIPSDKIIELNIFEAIDFPAISGNVIIDDWTGMKEIYNFFANDLVEISFHREGDPPILMAFVLSESGDESPQMGEHHKKIRFDFCSPWWVNARTFKISTAWNDKYIHEIITDLIGICGGKAGIILKTKQKLERFVAPNWSPIRIMRKLAEMAVDDLGCGGFLIWTDISDGAVNFMNLNSLMVNDSTQNYGTVPFKISLNVKNQRSPEKVFTMNIENSFDILKNGTTGVANTRTLSFDYDRTAVVDMTSRVDEYGHSHLSTKMPINTIFLGEPYQTTKVSTYYPNNRELIQTEKESESLQVGSLVNKQTMLLADLVKINLTTVGEHKAKRAGRLIWLDVPYSTEKQHEQYTGTYLIKNLRHRIEGSKYMNVCTLVCDGLKQMSSERPDIINWGKSNDENLIITHRQKPQSGGKRKSQDYRTTDPKTSIQG